MTEAASRERVLAEVGKCADPNPERLDNVADLGYWLDEVERRGEFARPALIRLAATAVAMVQALDGEGKP